ncbi:hypothetical protein F5Y06DRAFT_24446 [Hypoxylon sp. FL0890]|nr:hypothetical protein F5Y06DRAFT_24446 [Hypoxylon sp. FL0890]
MVYGDAKLQTSNTWMGSFWLEKGHITRREVLDLPKTGNQLNQRRGRYHSFVPSILWILISPVFNNWRLAGAIFYNYLSYGSSGLLLHLRKDTGIFMLSLFFCLLSRDWVGRRLYSCLTLN